MGEEQRPQRSSVARRLHSLRRDRESVQRILDQADLSRVREEATRTTQRISSMEEELSADAYDADHADDADDGGENEVRD